MKRLLSSEKVLTTAAMSLQGRAKRGVRPEAENDKPAGLGTEQAKTTLDGCI